MHILSLRIRIRCDIACDADFLVHAELRGMICELAVDVCFVGTARVLDANTAVEARCPKMNSRNVVVSGRKFIAPHIVKTFGDTEDLAR